MRSPHLRITEVDALPVSTGEVVLRETAAMVRHAKEAAR